MFVDAMFSIVNVWDSGVYPGWKGKYSSYDVMNERTSTGTTNGKAWDANRTVAWGTCGTTLISVRPLKPSR